MTDGILYIITVPAKERKKKPEKNATSVVIVSSTSSSTCTIGGGASTAENVSTGSAENSGTSDDSDEEEETIERNQNKKRRQIHTGRKNQSKKIEEVPVLLLSKDSRSQIYHLMFAEMKKILINRRSILKEKMRARCSKYITGTDEGHQERLEQLIEEASAKYEKAALSMDGAGPRCKYFYEEHRATAEANDWLDKQIHIWKHSGNTILIYMSCIIYYILKFTIYMITVIY